MTLKKKKTSPGEIHIHTLNIPPEFEEKEPSRAEITQLLSTEEQQRYDRYLVKRKKVEFYLARKLTKNLISTRLNIPGHNIELQPDSSGKPFLFLKGKPFPLYFNISHTSGFITCVISECKHTGIDVEHATGSRDNILQRFFHSREISEYMNLPQQQKDKRFYTLWTLKEAYLKAIGSGLHTPLNSFWFSITDQNETQTAAIHFDDRNTAETDSRFHFLHFQPTPKHFLAVAVKNNEKVQFIIHHHFINNEEGTDSP
jgi:4'-phosphopantetheinyl transferase